MKNEKWYVGFTDGDSDNEYEKFADDLDAIKGFLQWSEAEGNPGIWEIWECENDECLTPFRPVWSGVGYAL